MSNKADIATLINTNLANSSSITAAEHRGVLHTTADSILEAFYADEIEETQAAPSIFSVSSVNVEYDLTVSKIGRLVSIVGTITNIGATGLVSLLNIDDTNYASGENISYFSVGLINSSNEPIKVRVLNNTTLVTNVISCPSILFGGETVIVNIKYNTNA